MAGIVKDGLIGYWHPKQRHEGNKLINIARDINPTSFPDLIVYGATNNGESLYFDGVDDHLRSETIVADLIENKTYTLEIRFKLYELLAVNPIATLASRDMLYIKTTEGEGLNIGNNGRTHVLAGKIYEYETYTITYVMEYVTELSMLLTTYLNGEILGDKLPFNSTNRHTDMRFMGSSSSSIFSKGEIFSIRLYEKGLTQSEVLQNLSVGNNLGLDEDEYEEEPENPPNVTILSVSEEKISNQPNKNVSIIEFMFDKPVLEWRVNVFGSSWDTGFLADSGGASQANEPLFAEIDWTELQQEGKNKINIYGKDFNGNWTPYVESET